MRAALAAGAAAVSALAGCGFSDGGTLQAVPGTFAPPPGGERAGARDVGEDSRRPAWRLRARDGDLLRFEVTLRNEATNIVRVTDVRRDDDGGDGLFVPVRMHAPVSIPPDQQRRVSVVGRVDGCAGAASPRPGKRVQVFVTDGFEAHEVALRAVLEIECQD